MSNARCLLQILPLMMLMLLCIVFDQPNQSNSHLRTMTEKNNEIGRVEIP